MSNPSFGRPADQDGDWPYDPAEHLPEYPDPDTGMPGSGTQPPGEWHRPDALPADPGARDILQEPEPPPGWPGGGTYIPGQDTQPSRDRPYYSARRRHAAHRRSKRSPRRPAVIAVLVLAAVAAIAVVAIPRGGAMHLSPADSPTTGAARGLGVTASPGHASSHRAQPAAAQSPAITKAEAERVLSRYWKISNKANEQRSDSLLGTIEADSSYVMDTGMYRFINGSNPGRNYSPFAPVHAAYYIPHQSVRAAYPHWFVVAVTYAALAGPHHPTGSGYLLFSQDSPGAAWKEVLEPDALPGSGPAPRIATDAQGYAAAVSPGADAAGLSIAPGRIGLVTAAGLDNTRAAVIKAPGNLADEHDKAFWHSRLPAGSTDRDRHWGGPGPVFGLRTEDGGAILFYSVDAELTLAPPPGKTFRLKIPGYYSLRKTLTTAGVGYVEQFAAYDPPQGQGDPRIAADVSGIASRE